MDVPVCNVCHVPLDENEHQPRHLGCSHDACTACIKKLIHNGIFVCPFCKRLINANKAEDLPINHGVIQILRLFKGFKISENKQKEECAPTKTEEFCNMHKFMIEKRCNTCKVWICVQCQEFHIPNIGCEVQEYNEAMKKVKNEHKEIAELTSSSVKNNIESLSSKMFKVSEEIDKLNSIRKNLEKTVAEGTKVLNEVVKASARVHEANTSKELKGSIDVSIELQQFAQIWCKTNEEPFNKDLNIDQTYYTSLDIDGSKGYSVLSFEDNKTYIHCFTVQDLIHNKLINIIPLKKLSVSRDLVFLDLAISGDIQGRVTIRIRQDLVDYAKNIPLLFSGELGISLLGICFENYGAYNMGINILPLTSEINDFKRDPIAGHKVSKGSVLACWHGAKFKYLYIYHGKDLQPYDHNYEVFGQIESGLDTVKFCRKHKMQTEVTIVDCGLVINKH